jgi:hypothetical protein
MFDQDGHLTDEELVRLLDREASTSAMNDTRAHFIECSVCRSRQSQMEHALSKFADLYSSTAAPRMLQSSSGRRAELLQRLTVAELDSTISWPGRFAHRRRYLPIAATIFAIAIVALFRISTFTQNQPHSDQRALRLLPDRKLTPGTIRPVNLAEVCSQREKDLDPAVSDSIRKAVFQKYGMSETRTDNYQVDYLINPQLGGTADVHNLWPEPYGPTLWNAHAKDELEDRLHRMVCDKQIDLASAQREIATDWIAAYKRYFQSENPS